MNVILSHAQLISSYLWAALLTYWIYTSFHTKATAYTERAWSRITHVTAVVVGFLLLFNKQAEIGWLSHPVFPRVHWIVLLGLCLNGVGVSFAIWARAILGQNWSGMVTLKKDHELVRSGPYRWVRHPIYTGILSGVIGSVLIVNERVGFIGAALIFIAFHFKTQMEEKLLSRQFPTEYRAYKMSTKKIIPFVY